MEDRILVVGDVMLDHYILGDCDRISPEAPVPVVNIKSERYSLGGAGNLAKNLSNLGERVDLFGALGQDSQGKHIEALLTESGIRSLCFQGQSCTITKTRIMASSQQLLRVDREDLSGENDLAVANLERHLAAANYNFIIISDYGKGLCTDRVLTKLKEYAAKKECHLLIDPKGPDWEKYRGAYLVKPNLKELEEICHAKIGKDEDLFYRQAILIAKKFEITNLVITRGGKGMYHVNGDVVTHYPAQELEIYDVSGAGDTAMAAIAYMLFKGESMEKALEMANKAAGLAVTKLYTYAITKEDFQKL